MTKLDEVPQLINVLKGEMSLVGPRPEVAYFFDFYTEEEKAAIWSVRPGMTDYASIHFHDEDKLLAGAEDPVQAYLDLCRDKKVALQMKYIEERSLWVDLKVILATLATVIGSRFSPSKG
jgi:lipopolysaccharide/colanic/teichoic acid biosynthesis glycosyltransferase